MRPDDDTTNAFLYCLAVAAERTEVDVMFFLAMSNHYHAGVIDKAGRLPEFLAYFHKLFAKHQNVIRARWENFWAAEQTSVVELVDGDDVIAKTVYALTNPVKAHLVAHACEWPGASSLAIQFEVGRELRISRPRHFFKPNGPMPDQVALKLVRPEALVDLTPTEYEALLRQQIAAAEGEAEAERRHAGIRVMGVEAVLRQDWSDSPTTPEPRRQLSPRVACRNFWRRREALQRNHTFLDEYMSARQATLRGEPAIFPAGTYWFRRFGGRECAPMPVPN